MDWSEPKSSFQGSISTAVLSKKQKCTLQFYVEQEASRLFSLPLSQLADQLVRLEDQTLEANYDENQNDHWSYCWDHRN